MLNILYYLSKLLQSQLKVPYNRLIKGPVSHSQGSFLSPELSQNLVLQKSSAELSLQSKREPWCPSPVRWTPDLLSRLALSILPMKGFHMPLTYRYPEIPRLLQKEATQRHFHYSTTRIPLAIFQALHFPSKPECSQKHYVELTKSSLQWNPQPLPHCTVPENQRAVESLRFLVAQTRKIPFLSQQKKRKMGPILQIMHSFPHMDVLRIGHTGLVTPFPPQSQRLNI